MKLVFIRHGQTDYNVKGIIQGQEIDGQLNDTGKKQIESLSVKLPDDIDCIYSSPLKRAAQSAEILAHKMKKSVEFRDELKEFSYGRLAGKTWLEIAQITGDEHAAEKDSTATFDYSTHGGETSEQVKARLSKFIEDAKREHSSQTCIVASHGGIIDTMYSLYPQDKLPNENGGVHVFEV